ncbi:hypothetical protein CISG_04911 [Coccidioides immitis RMSCC 3703]|uniref:Uncharacterized protein n=2 Tax=Coccidioides immitis TaxID=5501 RepID=A0A0J8TPT7_COCIT|nr:hypothetical protein CIRG_08921 [Coccidioides immitis RMSCC 2394]KMU75737.1 hypothetical protein CISG_04911 [Coccidioides immitis RMSCC 3703]
MHHTEMTNDLWRAFKESQKIISLIKDDQTKRNAYSYIRSISFLFRQGLACKQSQESCKPVFKRFDNPNPAGHCSPYITCINANVTYPHDHFLRAINGCTQLDMVFLEELFSENVVNDFEACNVIEPNSTRKRDCVIFHAFLPNNIESCPWLLFVSHGKHTHPPPPPSKPPRVVMKRITQLVSNMITPNLTLTSFLKSPALEELCLENNTSSLSNIHASLTNMDRISTIIRKQRLLCYPEGQGYNSVLLEQSRNPAIKEYIQKMYQDPEGLMIICILKDQARLLSELNFFEVDMSYKRLKGSNLNEVVFATFLAQHAKVITLVRVFTEHDSKNGYYLLFKRVFDVIETLIGCSIAWFHLHGVGIEGVGLDMDRKQTDGLALYLTEIDTDHRDRDWQLRNIVIFSRVHFMRGITQAVGASDRGIGIYSRMASLLDCHSQEDYMQLCNLLIAHENQKVQDWARHKKDIIIASGLNKHCSLIPEHIYERLRKHTNAAEKTHNKSYAFGKHESLLQALTSSWKLDKRDILQYYAREDYGVCHSYQSSNIESLYHRHIQQSVQRRRSYSQFRASTEDVVDIDTRSQASTISAGSSLGNLDSISQRSPRPARRAR